MKTKKNLHLKLNAEECKLLLRGERNIDHLSTGMKSTSNSKTKKLSADVKFSNDGEKKESPSQAKEYLAWEPRPAGKE